MKRSLASICAVFLLTAAAVQASAQTLTNDELKKAVPQEYYFAGQKATVQVRNSVGFKSGPAKLTLAALVDTSGYATAIKEKYQGLLITETKLTFDGGTLEPGQYGFGFVDNKFTVMNVAATDLFSVTTQTDDQIKHAIPLKLEKAAEGYRLYAGKKYVVIKTE